MTKISLPNSSAMPFLTNNPDALGLFRFNQRLPLTLTALMPDGEPVTNDGYRIAGDCVDFFVSPLTTKQALTSLSEDNVLGAMLMEATRLYSELHKTYKEISDHINNKLYSETVISTSSILIEIDTDNLSDQLKLHQTIPALAKSIYYSYLMRHANADQRAMAARIDLPMTITVSHLSNDLARLIYAELGNKLVDADCITDTLLGAVRKLTAYNPGAYGHLRDKVINLPLSTRTLK